MNAKPYPKYKASGVDWLGDVSEHWEVKRLGYVAKLKSGESITAEVFDDSGEFPVFGGNGFRGLFDKFTHDGEYVLIGRQGALCGNINYGSGKFWASEHALVVSVLAQFDVFWMGELLRSMNLGQYSITAAQPGISAEAIRSLKIPIPPLSEQQLIGDFLRKKTARLSTLLGKKRELIVKLKEKRSALISRTVTKGLPPEAAAKASLTPNPNLKPSGIPWLGDIPEHWEVKKLSYITRMKSGETITSLDFTDDGIYPVFGGNGHRAYYSEFTHDGEFVLIGRQGALCGNINYAKGKFWASEHAIVVKPSFDLALFWLGELLRVMNLNQYSVWCGLCLRPTMIFARSVRKNRGDILRYIGMPSTRAFGLHRPPRC